MSVLSVFLIMSLVLIGIVCFCYGAIWLEKEKHGEEYDERQMMVRGRASQLASKVSEFCLGALVAVFVFQVDGERIIEPYLAVIAAFLIQSLVFHTYCTINHAALPVSQKPLVNFIGFLIIGSLWMYSALRYQQREPLSLVGYGSWGIAELLGAFYLYAIALMYLIQMFRRDKE